MNNIADTGTILIVDDTLTNLEVLFDCLLDSGLRILVAEDGISAIDKAKYASPDLILMDILMPEIDGFETCRRLKADEKTKEIPVIFMTALTETVDKLKGFNLGAVDYITKPFQQEEVLARIKTHLQLQNLTKQLQQQNQRLEEEIQERQRHEAALAASEERFRLLIETVKDYAIFMLAPNGQVVTWNTGAEKLKGYRAEEIIGQSFTRFYTDTDIRNGLPKWLLETALALGQVEDEGWRVRKDGTRFWANVVITALWDSAGELRGFSKVTRDLTARKQAEAERDRFFNLSLDIFCIGDVQGNLQQFNPAFAEVLGYTPEELRSQPIFNYLHPEDLAAAMADAQKVANGQNSKDFECRYRCKDGSYRWLSWRASAVPEAGLIYAVARDVTARKQQEAERLQLLAQEQQARAEAEAARNWSINILESITDAFVTLDKDWRYTYLNPQAEKVLKRKRADLLGKYVWDEFPEAVGTHSYYEYYRAVAEQVSIQLEEFYPPLNAWLAVHAYPFQDGLCIYFQDVTSRKQLEEILQNVAAGVAAETGTEFFRSLVRYLAEVLAVEYAFIAEIAPENMAKTIAVYANGEIADNFEYCIADTPCKNLLSEGLCIYPSNVRQKFPDSQFLAKNGIESYIGAPLIDTSGKTLGFLAVLSRSPIDNSKIAVSALQIFAMRALGELERTIADQKLQRQSQELMRSNAELQQFAYIASHDLQEPLRMIASYLQLLERRYKDKLDDNAREFIAYAVDGATRMKTLINDLLAYSRVGTHGKVFDLTDCNLVVKQAIANLKIAIEEKQATVTWDDLPEIVADTTQLIQLFQNLIGNAIKFQGANPPTVHIAARRQNQEWLFLVEDNGIGIEPQYADRIFVVFQRLHSRTEYPGTGIGLAICKKIVERHGGTIWVDSHPGLGSKFCFTIPDRDKRSIGF